MPTVAASTFAACLPTSLWPCADLLRSASRASRAGPQDARPRGPAMLSRARCAAMVAGQARPLVFVPQCSRPSALLAACGPRCRSRPFGFGDLSSLSTRSGRVATSESSEHKGCLRPARIPRRSQTASLRLNKAQRQRRGALHTRATSFCRAPERAPLTGQNDRRAAHVSAVGAARRVRWLKQLRTPDERLPQHINDCRSIYDV